MDMMNDFHKSTLLLSVVRLVPQEELNLDDNDGRMFAKQSTIIVII